MRGFHSIRHQSILVSLLTYILLPPALTKHHSKSKQTLQSTEETCQQPLGNQLHNFGTSILALCFSVTEYCCPLWSQSYHCKKVDTSLNECLRLVTGCIKSTLTELLPILPRIEPMDIR